MTEIERPTSSTLSAFMEQWLPFVEAEMRLVLGLDKPNHHEYVAAHYGMMHYHMGWVDEHFSPANVRAGKRLRPMMCLLACAEVGGDPAAAVPAAAALEILHNFSLIHDDIQDGDEMRRHRPTIWKLWGVPQGINVGDGMFGLAFASMQRLLSRGVSEEVTLQAVNQLSKASLELIEGQNMDLTFETCESVTLNEYQQMIQRKTASLMSASMVIGGLIGRATRGQCVHLQQFGKEVGLTFQIQDDILGIWGDPAITGKSVGNDILRRKKSLPLVYALNHPAIGPEFRKLWAYNMTSNELPTALDMLAECKAREFAESNAKTHHTAAHAAIRSAFNGHSSESALFAQAESLLNRVV